MQRGRSLRGFVKVSYNNRTFSISKRVFALCAILLLLIIGIAGFAMQSVARSAKEIERLQSELVSEQTINESLTREVQKHYKNIEAIANALSNEVKPKKTIQYNSITSMLQVYGILIDIQKNLQKIDKTMDAKIQNLRKVVNMTDLARTPSITKGIEQIHIAESIHAGKTSSSIQKASKTVSILSGIDISSISEKILIKKQGFDTILKTVSKIPLEMPVQSGRFVSGFGHRFHPIHKYNRMHNGIDFVAPRGAKVLATADGIIERAVYSPSYGNFVVIKHPGNIKTLYAHMSKIRVERGQKVKVGQAIGFQGTTGTSTGEHIHYEVIVNNQHKNPISFIHAKDVLKNL